MTRHRWLLTALLCCSGLLMHIAPGRGALFREAAAALQDRVPNMHVFDKPMDRVSFPIE